MPSVKVQELISFFPYLVLLPDNIAGGQALIRVHLSTGSDAIVDIDCDQRHLVTCYLFRTDAEWETAKQNGLISDMERMTRAELVLGELCARGRATDDGELHI
jgi:hypothetical protein